ncbi:M-phase inducer phosphatase [Carica papaya]|uniref:M-phase inducer phosphatase n=1 Tax=Carica papaya TaxID=3649 RepID=UPI000B8CD650|nr:M-phase inducer phosphatase [Carica papaya]
MAEIQPQDAPLNGTATVAVTTSEPVGSKRQRRPSVRLGDIGGDQPYDSHVRRSTKQWKHHHHLSIDHRRDSNPSGKTSKTRALTNLSSGGGDYSETLDDDKEGNLDSLAIGSWRVKESKKRGSMPTATKRVRSNWVSKIDDDNNNNNANNNNNGEGEDKYSGGEDMDEGYRDFNMENSESPLKEQSPIHSLDNLAVDGHGNERDAFYHHGNNNRRHNNVRPRVSENRDVELSGPSDTDVRDWRSGRGGRCGEEGVRIWLNGLGLGRYAPVFEIHEVDDEVLPFLTLEDLKDMGINAVGSRRKMYCAIQKLGKGFS